MRITLRGEQRLFFTSDTHYAHTNLCTGTTKWGPGNRTRDFKTLSQMNDAIVNSINSVVGQDDILIHLGDWSFGGIDKIWEFRKRIICKNIYLFLGNHDEHIKLNKVLPNVWSDENGILQDGPNPNRYGDDRDRMFDINAKDIFVEVEKLDDLEIVIPRDRTDSTQTKDKTIQFIACHFPIASWERMGRGVMHIHGHVHLPPNQKISAGKAMDVGMDGNHLVPYPLQEVVRTLRDRPIKCLVLPGDHHEKEGR